MISEAVIQTCSVKKIFLKIFKNSLVIICGRVKRVWYRHFPVNCEEISRTSILQDICEGILAWNEAMNKCFHVNIFTEKHRWGCHLKCICRYEGLEFYLKGTQSQIISCKLSEVLQNFSFTEHYFLLGNCFWLRATFLPCYFFFTLPVIYQFSQN